MYLKFIDCLVILRSQKFYIQSSAVHDYNHIVYSIIDGSVYLSLEYTMFKLELQGDTEYISSECFSKQCSSVYNSCCSYPNYGQFK